MSFEVKTWNSLVIISHILKTCFWTYFPWEFSQYIINIMDRWLAALRKRRIWKNSWVLVHYSMRVSELWDGLKSRGRWAWSCACDGGAAPPQFPCQFDVLTSRRAVLLCVICCPTSALWEDGQFQAVYPRVLPGTTWHFSTAELGDQVRVSKESSGLDFLEPNRKNYVQCHQATKSTGLSNSVDAKSKEQWYQSSSQQKGISKGFLTYTQNYTSVQFSHLVMSDSLRPHESQPARPPCPSPSPRVHSNSRPSSRWCHPAISSSVVPFSSCPQFLPASESFSNESTLRMRWPKYWSFIHSVNIIPSKEIPGLISFRMDWLDLLAVQGTLKSLLQHHSSKASILRHSAFFTVQLSHPYMTTGKTIALTRRTFVGKVMSLLLNMLSRMVITFLPRSKHL